MLGEHAPCRRRRLHERDVVTLHQLGELRRVVGQRARGVDGTGTADERQKQVRNDEIEGERGHAEQGVVGRDTGRALHRV